LWPLLPLTITAATPVLIFVSLLSPLSLRFWCDRPAG
jgi:hypothetical protein